MGEEKMSKMAMDQTRPLLDVTTADQQILVLLREIGELKRDLATHVGAKNAGRRRIGILQDRNASLEDGIKAVSARCYWRSMGYCDLGCSGRMFCDVKGLRAFNAKEGPCES